VVRIAATLHAVAGVLEYESGVGEAGTRAA
jgi:hypothetical protein